LPDAISFSWPTSRRTSFPFGADAPTGMHARVPGTTLGVARRAPGASQEVTGKPTFCPSHAAGYCVFSFWLHAGSLFHVVDDEMVPVHHNSSPGFGALEHELYGACVTVR
jgi:hypothetical protein